MDAAHRARRGRRRDRARGRRALVATGRPARGRHDHRPVMEPRGGLEAGAGGGRRDRRDRRRRGRGPGADARVRRGDRGQRDPPDALPVPDPGPAAGPGRPRPPVEAAARRPPPRRRAADPAGGAAAPRRAGRSRCSTCTRAARSIATSGRSRSRSTPTTATRTSRWSRPRSRRWRTRTRRSSSGDLNGTWTEPGLEPLRRLTEDAHEVAGTGPGFTWRPDPLEFLPFGILRIDHVLTGGWLRPLDTSLDCPATGPLPAGRALAAERPGVLPG